MKTNSLQCVKSKQHKAVLSHVLPWFVSWATLTTARRHSLTIFVSQTSPAEKQAESPNISVHTPFLSTAIPSRSLTPLATKHLQQCVLEAHKQPTSQSSWSQQMTALCLKPSKQSTTQDKQTCLSSLLATRLTRSVQTPIECSIN